MQIKTSEDSLIFASNSERERWVTILKALREDDFEVLEEFASSVALRQSGITTPEIKEQLFTMAPGTRPVFKLILRDYLNRVRGMPETLDNSESSASSSFSPSSSNYPSSSS